MSRVKGVSLSADSVAYAASVPKGTNYSAPVPKGTNKVLAARLELKHSAVLITFVARQRTKHHFMIKAKSP